MKKLMIVAAAAMGLAAFGDIESSNIVGYVEAEKTVEQFNFMTIGFNTVGCNTMDIQQLRIDDEGAGGIGWGEETFAIWAGAPDVVDGSEFFYYDPSMDPNAEAVDFYWGDSEGNKANFSIAAGQSAVVQCAGNLKVVTAGQVPTEPVEMTTVEGFNFIGNPFPAAIDIQALKFSSEEEGAIGWGEETFALWAGAPDVVDGSEFFYYDPSMDPNGEAEDYFWGDAEGNAAEFTIAIGQGAVIQCAGDLAVKILPPYSL